jgi:hypothetical protein
MSDKIEQFYRDATADDVARVMSGEVIEARFRDFDSEEWGTKILLGYLGCGPLGCNWIDMGGVGWKLCQVYDPPEILKNKPDPGEGWRLLEKFPPEEKEAGDEWFSYKTNDWVYAGISKLQRADVWYRRRIATAAPTIKVCDPLEIGEMCANADTTRFRKFVDKAKAGELSFTCSFVWQPLPEPVSVEAGHRIKHPNGCLIEITEDGIKINELVDMKLRKTQS